MQTFRKRPKQSPMTPAATPKMTSVPTRDLVQENPRCDGDVERFGATGERDRHPARRDGVQMRPDAGPLVAHDYGDHPTCALRSIAQRRHGALERLAVGRCGPE